MWLLLFFAWLAVTIFALWVIRFRKRFFYDWYEPIYHKYRMAGNKWTAERSVRKPKKGHAAVHVVTDVCRDQSNLFVCGISAFESTDAGAESDISIDQLMAMDNVSLYDSHEPQDMYIFFEIVPDLWEHPFHGMGHRELLKVGAKAYLVSMEDADAWTNANCKDVDGSEFLFMWNTSRCGSTLMTRILDKVGCVSLSEPMFMTNMYNCIRHDKKIDSVQRLRTTLMMERHLVRHQFKDYRKMCVKPQMGVKFVIECEKAFPGCKQMMIYRKGGNCIESLGSIGKKHCDNWAKFMMALSVSNRFPPRKDIYPGLYEREGWLNVRPMGNALLAEYTDYVHYWTRVSPKLKEGYLCFRFDELVKKDKGMMTQMLEFLGFGPEDCPAALKGFDKHSQSGHISEDSSSKTNERFLTLEQEAQCNEFIKKAGIPDLLPNSIMPRTATKTAA